MVAFGYAGWVAVACVYLALCGGGTSAGADFGPAGAAADSRYRRYFVELVDCGFWVGLELCFVVRDPAWGGDWRGFLRACFKRHDRGLLSGEAAGLGAGNFHAGLAAGEFSFFLFWGALGGGLRLAEGLFYCLRAGIAFGCVCAVD